MADRVLTIKQSQFVVAYVDNELSGGKLTGTEVALRVGYSKKTAYERSSALLALPEIQKAIADRKTWLAQQEAGPGLDARQVLREWAEIATADPTEVITVRRLNCRHCWGFQFGYQWTDAEYAKETAEEMQMADTMGRPAELDQFGGGPGFRRVRDPNPECPECCGEGVEDVLVRDLKRITGPARKLIAGVKQGRHGIEVQFRDQDAALRNLAQYLGLLVNRQEHTGKDGGPIQTQNANVNYTLPDDPVEAARQYQLLMEGK